MFPGTHEFAITTEDNTHDMMLRPWNACPEIGAMGKTTNQEFEDNDILPKYM